jgi:AcrR family transcriptional regulator
MMIIYERKRESTKQRILNAAINLLAEVGYDNLSITAIADAADVGRGTVYRYFGDLDGVVLHIFLLYEEQLRAQVYTYMAQTESPSKEYMAWQIAFEQAHFIKPLFQNMHSPDAQMLLRQFETVMIGYFQNSLEQGGFRYPGWMQLPVDVMATFTAGAVLTVMRRWFAGELDYSAQELGEMVYRLLYHEPHSHT